MNNVFGFVYENTRCFADPLKVRRVLLEGTDGRAWTYVRDLALYKEQLAQPLEEGTTPEQLAAHQAVLRLNIARLEGALAEAAIEAFELPPFNPKDGSGCTELIVLTILAQYMEFAAGKG